jgi:hypothetical protein
MLGGKAVKKRERVDVDAIEGLHLAAVGVGVKGQLHPARAIPLT